jgi:predicted ATP-grasp superfamily ATP-dependent carboligase
MITGQKPRPLQRLDSNQRSSDILVTADERSAVLAGLRALRAGGYRPWIASSRRGTYATRSRAAAGKTYVPDPARDPQGFVDALVSSAERVSATAVLPTSESALLALAGNDHRFPAGVAVGADSAEIVRRATAKPELLRLAALAGLGVPTTTTITGADVDRADSRIPFPAVVKPLRSETPGRDGRLEYASAQSVRTREGLEAVVESLPGSSWLVQPQVPGKLRAVSGVAWEGRLVCAMHQCAERTYPLLGPSAYAATIPPDEELEQGVARLLELLGFSGIFQAQFIASDVNYFIDFNPRMYGSLALAVGAGLNLPVIWADLLVGRSPRLRPYRWHVRYRSEERDARAIVAALLRGELRLALRGIVPRRRTVHAVFSLHDPLPLTATFTKASRAIARGIAHLVRRN